MLKIKDNVDLKELEKFGLKPIYGVNERTGETHIRCIVSDRYTGKYGSFTLIPKITRKLLYITNRIIHNNISCVPYFLDEVTYFDTDLLYDLIKADLVEKVEDRE